MILNKLENSRNLPKKDVYYLYQAAASNLSLPTLNPKYQEEDQSYWNRAVLTLRTHLSSINSPKPFSKKKAKEITVS